MRKSPHMKFILSKNWAVVLSFIYMGASGNGFDWSWKQIVVAFKVHVLQGFIIIDF